MSRDKISETNAITGETVERQMTVAEQKDRDAFLKANADEQAAAAAAADKKATQRQLILDKLGLTADEARLLLG